MKQKRVWIRIGLAGAVLWFLAGAMTAGAAPKAQLWERWLAEDPASRQSVDHTPWTRFLRTYVEANDPSGINRVRYAEVTPADRALLQGYLRDLQGIRVSGLNRGEQRAYWINLYNALTVALVLDNYPVKSITRINPGKTLFSRGPWDAALLSVEGESLSLNDVEHRILRPIWQDPRTHYAVNCASLGCPNLQPEAYTAANTEALLDRGARQYVNHPRGARLERGRLILSSIYDWFQEDFGGSEQGVLRHLAAYADGELQGALDGYSGRISYAYDWSLNEP
jgi:hypothetical protein